MLDQEHRIASDLSKDKNRTGTLHVDEDELLLKYGD